MNNELMQLPNIRLPRWADMLAAFKRLRERADRLHREDHEAHRGICSVVRWDISEALYGDKQFDSCACPARDASDNMIQLLFKELGYCPIYPVFDNADPIYVSAERQYDHRPHWQGAQLALRIKLLDECITYLEAVNEPTDS